MWRHWWKIIAIILILYSIIAGFLGEVPDQVIIYQSIRNLYFHVPMWFAMMAIFLISIIYSVKFLSSGSAVDDHRSFESVHVGFLLGILGLLTGMIWAKFTWGAFWVSADPQLNGAAATMIMYAAYFILRGSISDAEKRGRLSAVYNIFAFALMIVFIMILPKMKDSLHPGKGGNPGFNVYDLNDKMRYIFYPAVLGWILLSVWIMTLRVRLKLIEEKIENE